MRAKLRVYFATLWAAVLGKPLQGQVTITLREGAILHNTVVKGDVQVVLDDDVQVAEISNNVFYGGRGVAFGFGSYREDHPDAGIFWSCKNILDLKSGTKQLGCL